jgi:hypothetical protein
MIRTLAACDVWLRAALLDSQLQAKLASSDAKTIRATASGQRAALKQAFFERLPAHQVAYAAAVEARLQVMHSEMFSKGVMSKMLGQEE